MGGSGPRRSPASSPWSRRVCSRAITGMGVDSDERASEHRRRRCRQDHRSRFPRGPDDLLADSRRQVGHGAQGVVVPRDGRDGRTSPRETPRRGRIRPFQADPHHQRHDQARPGAGGCSGRGRGQSRQRHPAQASCAWHVAGACARSGALPAPQEPEVVVEMPAGLRTKPWRHQRVAYKFCLDHFAQGLHGILLAMGMGTGKTMVAL